MLGYKQGDPRALPKATLSQSSLLAMGQDSFSPERCSTSRLQDPGEHKGKPEPREANRHANTAQHAACRSHRGRTTPSYPWHGSPELQ